MNIDDIDFWTFDFTGNAYYAKQNYSKMMKLRANAMKFLGQEVGMKAYDCNQFLN